MSLAIENAQVPINPRCYAIKKSQGVFLKDLDKNSEIGTHCILSTDIGEAWHFFEKSLAEDEIKKQPELK